MLGKQICVLLLAQKIAQPRIETAVFAILFQEVMRGRISLKNCVLLSSLGWGGFAAIYAALVIRIFMLLKLCYLL